MQKRCILPERDGDIETENVKGNANEYTSENCNYNNL